MSNFKHSSPCPGDPDFKFDFVSKKGREMISHWAKGDLGDYKDTDVEYDDYNNLHCEDGPAFQSYVTDEGEMAETRYHIHGELHRTDGPAIEKSDGSYEYWQNDQLHRTDGPAYVNVADEITEWWMRGVEYSEIEFNFWMGIK